MANVVSLVEIRNGKVKDELLAYARTGETVIIQTCTGMISAEKIVCRGSFAEILNPFGDYFIVNYTDIRQLRPAASVQTSVVNASGDWSALPDPMPRPNGMSRVLRFPERGRSRQSSAR